MSMLCQRLLLLLLCALIFFVVGRARDLVTWVWFNPWLREVEPTSLPVHALLDLLDARGVTHAHVKEKTELASLVKDSGRITRRDAYGLELSRSSRSLSPAVVFISIQRFIQDVELASHRIWLFKIAHDDLEVINPNDVKSAGSLVAYWADTVWRGLEQDAAKFGVHKATLRCDFLKELCKMHGWNSDRFVLWLPRFIAKTQPALTYTRSLPQRQWLHEAREWLHQTLLSQLRSLTQPKHLEDWLWWHSFPREPELRVVLLTDKKSPPLFFTGLSPQYRDLAKFGWVYTGQDGIGFWTQDVNPDLQLPVILVQNSEGVYTFGQVYEECLSYACLKLFLDYLRPSQNTVFNVSIGLVLVLALFDLVIYPNFALWRFLKTLAIYVAVVIILLLLCTAEESWAILKFINATVVKFVRYVSLTSLGSMLRRDVLFFRGNLPMLIITVLLVLFSLIKVKDKFYKVNSEKGKRDNDNFSGQQNRTRSGQQRTRENVKQNIYVNRELWQNFLKNYYRSRRS